LATLQELAERRRLLQDEYEKRAEILHLLSERGADLARYWSQVTGRPLNESGLQPHSVALFLGKGLSSRTMMNAMNKTVQIWDERGFTPDDAWRYFCAICWNRIRDREGTPDDEQ